MAEKNGISKIVRIITLIILIAGLLITFGASYATLNLKINVVERTATQADEKSCYNEKAIINIKKDLEYIIKGIDELKGGK